MSQHQLGDGLCTRSREAAQNLASEIACEINAEHYGGEASTNYHAFVEDAALEAILDAIHRTTVLSLDEWGEDGDLNERAERELERSRT